MDDAEGIIADSSIIYKSKYQYTKARDMERQDPMVFTSQLYVTKSSIVDPRQLNNPQQTSQRAAITQHTAAARARREESVRLLLTKNHTVPTSVLPEPRSWLTGVSAVWEVVAGLSQLKPKGGRRNWMISLFQKKACKVNAAINDPSKICSYYRPIKAHHLLHGTYNINCEMWVYTVALRAIMCTSAYPFGD
uniref:SFRICE_008343 n=1 Tax=Spodoptera frugiperda TaxID=7108 RepID=A0A2H1UZS4_SPOFR